MACVREYLNSAVNEVMTPASTAPAAHHAPLLAIVSDIVFAGAPRSLDDAARQAAGAGAHHASDASLRGKAVHHRDREFARVGIRTFQADHLLNSAQQATAAAAREK